MTKNAPELPDQGRQYRQAYLAHYGAKRLREALGLYKGVIATFPDSAEAQYSRSQIHNIFKAVVPADKIFETEEALALAHLDLGD
jgi:hypothetical protein